MINQVILLGRLGGNPELRYTPAGQAVANASLATSENWTDRGSGERKERTEWHRLVFWGPAAETIAKFAVKGTQLYVQGMLRTREWEKDGQKHHRTEVQVDVFRILDWRDRGQEQPYDGKHNEPSF